MRTYPSTGLLVRPLDPIEAMFAATGLHVGHTVRVRGQLNAAALAEAFDLLRRKYPMLSCRIVLDRTDRVVFEAADELPALFSWTEKAGTRLPDLTDRVAAIHVARVDTETSLVTLLLHHAAADGRHGLQLMTELWAMYTAVVEGRAVHPDRQDYPRSVTQLLDERGLLPQDGALPDFAPAAGAAPSARSIGRARLTTEQTNSLVLTGHLAHTTINGLVSAALLQATAEFAGVELPEVLYAYPVDLRTRLTPPVGRTEGTNVLGATTFTAHPGTPNSTFALARAVNAQLDRAITSGDLYRAVPRHFDPTDPAGLGLFSGPTSSMSTNWGVIPSLAMPDDLTVTDFIPSINTGSRHPANTLAVDLPYYSCIVTTFQGQLTLDLITGTDANTYAHRVAHLLTLATA